MGCEVPPISHRDIHPLTLGTLTVPSNLIQAPLAGVSTAAFREGIWSFGGVGYCTTEMISAKTLLHHPPKRYIFKSEREGLLCFQLSGNSPFELAQAASRAVALGADLIDLNCGCPVDKIRKKHGGSAWLSQPKALYQALAAMKAQIGSIPLTIKIRVDGESGDGFNADIVKAACDAGVAGIIVHGRHWTESYDQPVRLDEIAQIVQIAQVYHIPVIGNGDIKDHASFSAMMRHTGCAGAMIGRASVGRPWLFAHLMAIDKGVAYRTPTPHQIGELLLAHVQRLIDLELEPESIALLQARTLGKYFLRAAGRDSNEAMLAFSRFTTWDALVHGVGRYFACV